MQYLTELEATISDMVQKGRGILAADESSPTIAKRFQAIDLESTEENRRILRSFLVTTPGLGEYISGNILFEETLEQKTDEGKTIPQAAWNAGSLRCSVSGRGAGTDSRAGSVNGWQARYKTSC
jgi:fructose-bisphosphate aldolase class I